MTDGAQTGRLTRRAQFKAAASGCRHHTPRMTLQARAHGDDETGLGLSFGLTVTRKVGHAVVRNRIRRRLRAALLKLPASARAFDADVVIVARRDAISASFSCIIDDLTIGLSKLAQTQRRSPCQKSPRDTSRLSSDASAQIT